MKKIDSILYVEDEKGIQEKMSFALKTFCNRLIIADDGIQALRLYKQQKPQVVISDIKMPNMDGLELTREIKEIKKINIFY